MPRCLQYHQVPDFPLMSDLLLLRYRVWVRTTYGVGDHSGENGSVGVVCIESADENRDHGDLDEGDLKEASGGEQMSLISISYSWTGLTIACRRGCTGDGTVSIRSMRIASDLGIGHSAG